MNRSADATFELVDLHPEVQVSDAEYFRLLGYPPNHKVEGRASELARAAREWYMAHGRPWIYGRETPLHLSPGRVQLNGAAFSSSHLHRQMADAEAGQAVVVLVSAGKACEERARELWREGKPDEYFFMEMFGSAVVEALVAQAGARLCAWAEEKKHAVLPHYSPGYPAWDIADQGKLFELLRGAGGSAFPEEIAVLESGMLRPKKSLLALFGVTSKVDKLQLFPGLVPCHNCSFSPCQYRRAPYRNGLPQVEDVRALQPRGGEIGSNGALHPAPKYSIHPRALEKWWRERLQLLVLEDRTLQARFRYEGTTCSNLGRPIKFDYYVKLAPAEQNYRILEAGCVPSPGDTGHTHMCEYLANPGELMGSIRAEKPLAGKPLAEIFNWEKRYSPAGCYCDLESRKHKWGLVFEVIHYGLAKMETEKREQQKKLKNAIDERD